MEARLVWQVVFTFHFYYYGQPVSRSYGADATANGGCKGTFKVQRVGSIVKVNYNY